MAKLHTLFPSQEPHPRTQKMLEYILKKAHAYFQNNTFYPGPQSAAEFNENTGMLKTSQDSHTI